MKNKNKISYFLLFFALISLVIGINLTTSKAETVIQIKTPILSEYFVGDSVEIPNGVIMVDGETFVVEPIVYSPNGKGEKVDFIKVSQMGQYEIFYIKDVNGKRYSKTCTFNAIAKTVAFENDKSNYSYGVTPKYFTLEGANEKGNIITTNGLSINLFKGDVIRFNEIIDLSKAGTKDSLIDFYLMPEMLGTTDAKEFYIELTDAFDETNKITICYKLKRTDGYSYIVAKANNQSFCGLESKYDGGSFVGYTPRINDSYGQVTYLYGGGVVDRNAVQKITLYFDTETNILYHTNVAVNTYVNDFDDPSIQTQLWNGFKSNYVYLSMYAQDYTDKNVNIFVSHIAGLDLSKDVILDDKAPDITIQNENLELNSLPNGVVGLPYRIFDATAIDLYSGLDLEVSKRIFFNYEREHGIYNSVSDKYDFEIAVNNNSFIPKMQGKYAIVYSSKDYCGNYVEYVYPIEVENTTLNELNLTLYDGNNEVEVGNIIYLANINNISGYNGNYYIERKVCVGDTEIDILGNDILGYYFIPKVKGNYTVNYLLSDTTGRSFNKSYQINVLEPTSPSIDSSVTLPKYFIQEYTYSLPNLYAIDYNNDFIKVKANVIISDGAGSREYNGEMVSFVPNSEGNAVLTYSVGNNSVSYTVPIVSVFDGDELKLSKYFYEKKGAEVYAVENGVELTSRNSDASVDFVNKVLTNNFITDIKVDTDKNDFEFITVSLQDSVNPLEIIRIGFKNENGYSKIYINGEYSGINTFDVFHSENKISLSYNEKDNSFSDGAVANIKPKTYVYGNVFNGFSSGLVYVNYEISGVNSRSKIYIQKINNQNLNSNVYEDRVKPEFLLNGRYDIPNLKLNEKITVYSARYSDVLSAINSATVSVTYEETAITDVNGTVLRNVSCDREYEFSPTLYGKYVITYSIIDASGRSQGFSYSLSVVDMQVPNISSSMKDMKCKLGDIVNIESAKATDNIDSNIKVYTYVICPNYTVKYMTDKSSFKALEVGVYMVRYVATDSSGNTSYLDFKITVEGV